jgi:hypothetical protein
MARKSGKNRNSQQRHTGDGVIKVGCVPRARFQSSANKNISTNNNDPPRHDSSSAKVGLDKGAPNKQQVSNLQTLPFKKVNDFKVSDFFDRKNTPFRDIQNTTTTNKDRHRHGSSSAKLSCDQAAPKRPEVANHAKFPKLPSSAQLGRDQPATKKERVVNPAKHKSSTSAKVCRDRGAFNK